MKVVNWPISFELLVILWALAFVTLILKSEKIEVARGLACSQVFRFEPRPIIVAFVEFSINYDWSPYFQ